MEEIIEVQFRVLNNEVIAVFPYLIEGRNDVASYMHVGQHSGCDWNINSFTKAATPKQYENLLNELKSIGYDNLKVIKRRDHSKYLKEYYKQYQPNN